MTDTTQQPDDMRDVARIGAEILDRLETVVIGKRDRLRLILAAVLTGGHVLLEDNPGMGKTLTARTLAAVLGLEFRRVQFTPDLVPADVTGAALYDQRRGEFRFAPGPVFTQLLLADEINRTPPRTQAALLEAMQEHQVTVDGTTHPLPVPFLVIATANSIEYEGTYPLPEAQLDRFLFRLSFGYPDADSEWSVVARRIQRRSDEVRVEPILDPAGLRRLQAQVESVRVEESVGRYAVALTVATRERPGVLVGASPRGSLALTLAARGLAALDGRDFVVPDDVKQVAVPALAHRITLRPEMFLRNLTAEAVVRGVLDDVAVPASGARPVGTWG